MVSIPSSRFPYIVQIFSDLMTFDVFSSILAWGVTESPPYFYFRFTLFTSLQSKVIGCLISTKFESDFNPLPRYIILAADTSSDHNRLTLSSGYTYMLLLVCLLYTSPSPRDRTRSRMPSSA